MTFRLGKTPARPGAVRFALAKYLDRSKLPTPPKEFGHEALVPANGWGFLGNDKYGDCVFAGAAHETMMWTREGGTPASFTDHAVLSDYSAVTGFNPNDPNTDQGTDMELAAKYRRKTGVVDGAGNRHQVAAYLAINKGTIEDHLLAVYLFGAVGMGFNFPDSAMRQFNAGKPWTVSLWATVEGGHYVPLVARRNSRFVCVTWGKTQVMSDTFFRRYNDESVAYVSAEALVNRKSAEGFDYDTLIADLNALAH